MEDRRNGTKRSAAAAIGGENGAEDCGDPELWKGFDQSFRQVQTVLDRNRSLIQQVNENHQSGLPDNMAKNVALIQELNGNISKVVSLYSDLNTNFSSFFHNHRSPNGKPDAPEDELKDLLGFPPNSLDVIRYEEDGRIILELNAEKVLCSKERVLN